jgi:hypothetical protein
VTGHATVDLTVGGVALTRSTDGVSPNSDDAVKIFVDGSLRWFKHDDQGQLLGGATFEVCRTHNWNSETDSMDDITDDCVSVLDDNAPDTDPTPGEFQLDDLILGRYTVQETAAPAGWILDPDTVTVDLWLDDPDDPATRNKTISEAFVNTLGMISWEKRLLTPTTPHPLQSDATFEVSPNPFFCRGAGSDPLVVADDTDTIVGPGPDMDPDGGQFKLNRVCTGTYTITETVIPIGTQPDPDVTRVITVSDGTPNASIGSENVDDEGTRDLITGECTDDQCDFHNLPPNEGCTPGWWKNSGLGAFDQASDAVSTAVAAAVTLAGYGPSDGTHTALFRLTFGLSEAQMNAAGVDPNLTLLGAVNLGGGDFNAIARQGTSALLNSVSVNYPYNAAQVLTIVHDAYATLTVGTVIDDFNTANNLDHSSCPTG